MARKANDRGLEVERSATAVLILDMLSRFEFPDGAATAGRTRDDPGALAAVTLSG
jgi:hypothetical protein